VHTFAAILLNISAADGLRALIVGVLVLGILVLLHEWGHFVAAKLCGVRVDVFSIGFGPRLWGVKRGDTDYRLSALPLGGYVRMAGDNPVEERTGAPYEFLSRPRWQRFIIAVAGPITNILLTFVIGDRIVTVNGKATASWEAVYSREKEVASGAAFTLGVLRDGKLEDVTVHRSTDKSMASSVTGYPAIPATIDEINPASPAQKAGLRPGDTITAINGKPVITWSQVLEAIQGSSGHAVHFTVRREGEQVAFDITPMQYLNPATDQLDWMVGASRVAEEAYEKCSVFEAAQGAFAQTVGLTKMIGDVVTGLFRGLVSVRDLAGPVGIMQMSGQAAKHGTMTLLGWIAYISLDLGLLNLLPIPIMDGGHVLLLAIEGTLRRDLSITAKERFVQVGLVFLLGLFAFVMYSDILRLFQQTH
jgi:regulator of sigma E protease